MPDAFDGLIQNNETLRAENAELRKALKDIANHPEQKKDGDSSYSVGWAFWNVQRIARAALDPGRPVPHHGSGPASAVK